MPGDYKQVLVQNVESVVPNSPPVILNNVSQEHAGWFTFAEIETKHFISKILTGDSICIDIGANIGMYSLLFLQLSASSKVIAFEPSSNFIFLKRNIPNEFKNRFDAFQIALGDKDEIIEEEIWESFGHNKVRGHFQFQRLDSFLESNRIQQIDIIKIDTDGFEIQILNGALKTLSKYLPVVIIESDPDPKSGQSSAVIAGILKEIGYKRLGSLDGFNDVYVHANQRGKQKMKRVISRGFILRKSFLGGLAPLTFEGNSKENFKEVNFTSSVNSKIFFKSFFNKWKPME